MSAEKASFTCASATFIGRPLIRDQALFASGLLVEKLGGPSVRPYQPPGLWKELTGSWTTSRTVVRAFTAGASTKGRFCPPAVLC
jgi:hypothetical protein